MITAFYSGKGLETFVQWNGLFVFDPLFNLFP